MKYYKVKVNGRSYEVEVEEVQGLGADARQAAESAAEARGAEPAAQAQPGAAAPAAESGAAEAAGAEPLAEHEWQKEGATPIKAPMPGTILELRVEAGQSVEKNAVLCVLEAMKMENEIMSPVAGRVARAQVARGSVVKAGDLLFVIEG